MRQLGYLGFLSLGSTPFLLFRRIGFKVRGLDVLPQHRYHRSRMMESKRLLDMSASAEDGKKGGKTSSNGTMKGGKSNTGKKKFYAVAGGLNEFYGVTTTWKECSKLVTGVSNVKFKGFQTLNDAEEFVRKNTGPKVYVPGATPLLNPDANITPENKANMAPVDQSTAKRRVGATGKPPVTTNKRLKTIAQGTPVITSSRHVTFTSNLFTHPSPCPASTFTLQRFLTAFDAGRGDPLCDFLPLTFLCLRVLRSFENCPC